MEITIKNTKLELGFDAETVYRYSSVGGCVELLEGKQPPADKAFFCLVSLTWAMLKGKSTKMYPTPVSMAGLFIPMPQEDVMGAINAVIAADAPKLAEAGK